MKAGTKEAYQKHLEMQFPTEKKAIAEIMELISVSLSQFL